MNRKNFPPQLRGLKLDHLSSKWYRSDDDGILCLSWRDKKARKPCILVSTYETMSHTDVRSAITIIRKPTMVHQYNYNMNGCDRVDQCLSYYGQFSRRTTKCWKIIFFWLLEVTQCNAHILYQITRDNDSASISLKQYKESLVIQLCDGAAELVPDNGGDIVRSQAGRPRTDNTLQRLSVNKHLVDHCEMDRNCVVCSTRQKRRRTNYICTGCPDNPHLHPKDCFLKYQATVKLDQHNI